MDVSPWSEGSNLLWNLEFCSGVARIIQVGRVGGVCHEELIKRISIHSIGSKRNNGTWILPPLQRWNMWKYLFAMETNVLNYNSCNMIHSQGRTESFTVGVFKLRKGSATISWRSLTRKLMTKILTRLKEMTLHRRNFQHKKFHSRGGGGVRHRGLIIAGEAFSASYILSVITGLEHIRRLSRTFSRKVCLEGEALKADLYHMITDLTYKISLLLEPVFKYMLVRHYEGTPIKNTTLEPFTSHQ